MDDRKLTPQQRFGKRLKKIREEKGLSRKELMKLLEEHGVACSLPTASAWESGTRYPSPEVMEVLIDVLGITASHLIGPETQERHWLLVVYDNLQSMSIDQQAMVGLMLQWENAKTKFDK